MGHRNLGAGSQISAPQNVNYGEPNEVFIHSFMPES
jgi:hypothetical protein